jgi:cytochrome c553
MRSLLFFILSALSCFSFANQQAMQKLNQLKANPAAQQLAYESGHERITFCKYCHGEDGNSKRNYIPNLAEQNPIYLFNAFEKFANGERQDFVMSKLATNLTLEDRVNIALYYGLQKVADKPAEDQRLSEKGQAKFQQFCQGCHGEQGQGKENMPRLAGQPIEYIKRTLEIFRNKDPSRATSVMFSIAENMSDEDILSVANHIQALKP